MKTNELIHSKEVICCKNLEPNPPPAFPPADVANSFFRAE
jgi:hypothetical protein